MLRASPDDDIVQPPTSSEESLASHGLSPFATSININITWIGAALSYQRLLFNSSLTGLCLNELTDQPTTDDSTNQFCTQALLQLGISSLRVRVCGYPCGYP